MAFKSRASKSDPYFTLVLPMRCQLWQIHKLDRMFRCYNHMKNALIAREKKALVQLERTKEWKCLRAEIAASYKAIEAATSDKERLTLEKKQKKLFGRRENILRNAGFNMNAFEHAMIPMQKHYIKLTNSAVTQRLADNVWGSFHSYLYGSGKEVHFTKEEDFLCIEAKSNKSGIIFHNNFVGSVSGMDIPVVASKTDRYGYEAEALQRKISYCKISRKAYPEGWRYFLQIVLSGNPPIKIKPESGELLHPLGKGRVGNDIGPQTLATVSDTSASLVVFCEKVQDIQAELRRVNRAMDRSRRATNPKMFRENGTVVPIDELPDECVFTLRGKRRRKWIESKQYKALRLYRRVLYRQQRDHRKQAHNELANRLLSLGDEHYIETMNWQALAKRAKETKVSEKTGKYQRKKRFGKSIANKAPASFVKIYETKVKAAGGSFVEINTRDAKASQYNHKTKAYKKKHLSQRWEHMPDGTKVQRDLYSAFLIQNTNFTHNGFEQEMLEAKYPKFKEMHDAEIQRLSTTVMPSSTGVKYVA